MPRLSVPTTARLPSSLRVDSSNPTVVKSLNRLSREILISLALDWLDEMAISDALPYLRRRNLEDEDEDEDDDADDLYPPCRSVRELQQLYIDMQEQKGSKRDVASRILEGDWRHGLTLYQLAMVDFAYFDKHPTSQKWTAYRILPLRPPSEGADDEIVKVDSKSLKIPRFHPSTFLRRLQDQVLPDTKAHYHFHRCQDHPVLILRIFAVDSPYNSDLALSSLDSSGTATNFSSSRTFYLAFPDGSPSLYISKSQSPGESSSGESKSLQTLIMNGVPKALSRPRERYTVKLTNLTSRNLGALLDKKGSGRGNAAGGGWSIYADEKNKTSPLDSILPTPPLSRESSSSANSRKRSTFAGQETKAAKRAKVVAKARFGDSAVVTDGKGVEKVDVVIEDPFPGAPEQQNLDQQEPGQDDDENPGPFGRRPGGRRSQIDAVLRQVDGDEEDSLLERPRHGSKWTPTIRITFHGSHVFAGVRQLVEAGIMDGERMPGWLTGEEGVTTGVVREGRIRGHKGSDI